MPPKKLHLAVLGNGQGYHMPKWLRALARTGITITLLSYTPPDKRIKGVTNIPLQPLLRGKPNWLDFWRNTAFVKKYLVAHNVDVLMASYATSYGLLALRCGFHPLLLQTWTFDISHYPTRNWRRVILGPIVKRVLQAADAITTDGEALANYLQQQYPKLAARIVSMQWGIELANYEPSKQLALSFRKKWAVPKEAPIVVSGRGVHHWYRPEVVLPALWNLLSRHSTVFVFVLTVLHKRPPKIQDWLDRLGEHPRARVIDQLLNTSEMRAVWSAADIMISVPADDGISEAILEAMYARVLPVVSDIGSNRSFLDEEQAFFVQGHAADELEEEIDRVVRHLPAYQRERLDVNQAWVAREASVQGTAQRMHELITHLHKRHTERSALARQ